jgi:hypothetical protein
VRRRDRTRRADLAFAGFCLAVAGVTWWEARALPPGKFDPLGPGTVPILLCFVMAGLAGLILLRLAIGLAVGHARTSLVLGVGVDARDLPYRLRPALAVATFLLTALYVLAMHRGGLGFLPATGLFLALLGALLVPRTPWAQGLSLVLALVVAVLLNFVFRTILIVDLP